MDIASQHSYPCNSTHMVSTDTLYGLGQYKAKNSLVAVLEAF